MKKFKKNLTFLNQMKIDGTFKTNFWKGTHYCMLVVAIEKGMDYKKL